MPMCSLVNGYYNCGCTDCLHILGISWGQNVPQKRTAYTESPTIPLVEEKAPFLNTCMSSIKNLGNRSRRRVKPGMTVLARPAAMWPTDRPTQKRWYPSTRLHNHNLNFHRRINLRPHGASFHFCKQLKFANVFNKLWIKNIASLTFLQVANILKHFCHCHSHSCFSQLEKFMKEDWYSNFLLPLTVWFPIGARVFP
jgi:hypothetical protein